MSRKSNLNTTQITHEENFVCCNCGRCVSASPQGTKHRNHCPYCLWSRHLDRSPGDRRSACRGSMAPIGIWMYNGEWLLLHRCNRCSIIRSNRISGDDSLTALLALAAGPLANPPWPEHVRN